MDEGHETWKLGAKLGLKSKNEQETIKLLQEGDENVDHIKDRSIITRRRGAKKSQAKFGAEVAKESARNEKIAKKSLKAKSRAYAYAPKEPMHTHCHDLGVTS
ncbi:hypothetical protein PIB30_079554 [Stylosanthes scabra]|uniref:Uncharacterized protein n=1 Tax=Stylosanthes scabra TaxID=79078 RepID=A0ABU6QS13_9FABA|nr:hypothetical protein [Stylosanthes scabra]